jgi:hypothetical protein
MNELQLIRRQVALEREHLLALSRKENNFFSVSYNRYLIYILNQERSRSAAHLRRLSAASGIAPAQEAALANLKHALEETANAAPDRRAALLGRLIDSAERVEALVEQRYTIDDWRSVARIDADSVLEERRLWAEVLRDGSGS